MPKISEEQFLKINQFLNELGTYEFLIKYDGEREARKYTVILRNTGQTTRKDTDFPYEELIRLVGITEVTYNNCIELFLKEMFGLIVSRYGSDCVVLISLKSNTVWVHVINNKRTICTLEGDVREVSRSFYGK